MTGQAVLFLLWLLVVKTVFHALGGRALGILYFSLMVATLSCSLGDLGFSATVVREVARHPDDSVYIERLLRTYSLLYWGCAIAAGAALWAAAPWLAAHWLHTAPLDMARVTRDLRVVGAGALLTLPRGLYTSLFRGMQRMGTSTAIEVGGTAVQHLGAVALVYQGAAPETVFLWWGVSFAAATVLGFLSCTTTVPLRALLPAWHPEVVSRTAGYTGSMVLVAALTQLYTHLDKIVVGALLPLSMLGFYGTCFNAVVRFSLPANAVGQAAFPSFAAYHASGDRVGLAERCHLLQDVVTLGSAPVFAAIVFFAGHALGLLFDPLVAAELLVPVRILAAAFYLGVTLVPLGALVQAAGRPAITVRFNALAVCSLAPCLYLLVRELGLRGAAGTWVLYQLVAFAFVPRILRECLGAPAAPWFRRMGALLLLVFGTYGAVLAALSFAGAGLGLSIAGYMAASAALLLAVRRFAGASLSRALLQGRDLLAPLAGAVDGPVGTPEDIGAWNG